MRERRARAVRDRVRRRAGERGLVAADLWRTTGRPYRGEYSDGWHPNDRGHRRWALAVTRALGLPDPPAADASTPRRRR